MVTHCFVLQTAACLRKATCLRIPMMERAREAEVTPKIHHAFQMFWWLYRIVASLFEVLTHELMYVAQKETHETCSTLPELKTIPNFASHASSISGHNPGVNMIDSRAWK